MLAIAGSCGFTSSGYDAGLGVLRLQNGGKPRRGGAEDQCDAETDDDDAVVESAGAAHRRRSPAAWWGGVMMSRRRYGDMTGAGPGSASYCRNRLWRRPAASGLGIGLPAYRNGSQGLLRRCTALLCLTRRRHRSENCQRQDVHQFAQRRDFLLLDNPAAR